MSLPNNSLRTVMILVIASLIPLLGGCSSPSSRIARNQAAFDTWPESVQDKVRAGEVATGFTQEQVRVALGGPDRVYTRTTALGTTEVWAWQSSRPSVGLGIGLGTSSSGGTSMGLGTGISTGDRTDDRMRVIFDHGVVSAVEQLR